VVQIAKRIYGSPAAVATPSKARKLRPAIHRIEVTLLHLLKWAYQQKRCERSWEKSLLQARHRLAKLSRDNPSLANQVPGFLDEGYPHARRLAALETSLPLTTFPATCPWASEQALDENFWPEMAPDGT
jgi:hypothetical protein